MSFQLCIKTLCSKASLDGHVKTIHTWKETRFMCRFEGCPKFFRDKYERSSHEISNAHVKINTKQPPSYRIV